MGKVPWRIIAKPAKPGALGAVPFDVSQNQSCNGFFLKLTRNKSAMIADSRVNSRFIVQSSAAKTTLHANGPVWLDETMAATS
jgi:hypothetical protein